MTAIARKPRKLTVDEFLAFYMTRPDEEQWQLVDGVALLMTAPYVAHQRIARNLEHLLNDALEGVAPHLVAEQRIGIELPEFPHYRPEPDVVVIDLELPPDRRHVDRFYLTAEVLSASDDERIDLKRGLYRSHEHNQAILLIRQDIYQVELDRRDAAGSWTTDLLKGADAGLHVPWLSCRVGDLYKDVAL